MKKLLLSIGLILLLVGKSNSQTAHFDYIEMDSTAVANGLNYQRELIQGDYTFFLDSTVWSTWTGWCLSATRDSSTKDYTNATTAKTSFGTYKSSNYLVANGMASVKLKEAQKLAGTYLNNTVYAYDVIKNGNMFTKDQMGFGGKTGNDPDYFLVRAVGFYQNKKQDSVDFYLADYRFTDNNDDYIIEDWTYCNLSGLGIIDSLVFSLHGSDVGSFGLNTPAYFALDDFNAPHPTKNLQPGSTFDSPLLTTSSYNNGNSLPGSFVFNELVFRNNYNSQFQSWSGFALSSVQDTVTEGFLNQYASYASAGVDDSNYLVANTYGTLEMNFPYQKSGYQIAGLYITNSTYSALSMKNGDAFAKKFGGPDGTDPDYFRLIASGFDYENQITGTDTFYLADYRFKDASLNYIVKDWQWFDLKALGNQVVRITFELQSSDVGAFGMNTPAYFCIDNFNLPLVPIAVKPYKLKSDFNIYPNPFVHHINLILSEASWVTVYNLQGKRLYSNNLSKGNHIIDLSEIPKGVYILQSISNGVLESKRIIKQ